jgi:hypothetical protein
MVLFERVLGVQFLSDYAPPSQISTCDGPRRAFPSSRRAGSIGCYGQHPVGRAEYAHGFRSGRMGNRPEILVRAVIIVAATPVVGCAGPVAARC